MQSIEIDQSLLKPDEKDMLEDLIVAAHNDAKQRMDAEVARQMKDITGGMPLPPGMQLPF
jgi:DNA-binding protein YbaB